MSFVCQPPSNCRKRSRVCKIQETLAWHVFPPSHNSMTFRRQLWRIKRGVCYVYVQRNKSPSCINELWLALHCRCLQLFCSAQLLLLPYPHLLTLARIVALSNSHGNQDGCICSKRSHFPASLSSLPCTSHLSLDVLCLELALW